MRLRRIDVVRTFRAIDAAGPFELSDLNLFVGPNNAGKSSLFKAILGAQQGFEWSGDDIRLGSRLALAELTFEDVPLEEYSRIAGVANADSVPSAVSVQLFLDGTSPMATRVGADGANFRNGNGFSAEPRRRCFVPFFAGRRPTDYDRTVSAQSLMGPARDLRQLTAQISNVGQASHPRHSAFSDACLAILGFNLGVAAVANGQLPGIWGEMGDGSQNFIPITELGAGVAHIAGFLAEIATSSAKVFVIEEPETELHPGALRGLLRLIEAASDRNQFLISTHSSLVVRHLGGRDQASVFALSPRSGWPPTVDINVVAPDPAARSEVLLRLGYYSTELAAYDGWIFFEESTAERFVGSYLIPWFCPQLQSRVRTVSTNGAARAPEMIEDLWRVILFSHLEDRYRGRAWAFLDDDDAGRAAKSELDRRFPDDEYAGRFRLWSRPAFEEYLPQRFAESSGQALAILDAQARREAKAALWDEVWFWLESDAAAKEEIAVSAKEVVEAVQRIADELAHLLEPDQALATDDGTGTLNR